MKEVRILLIDLKEWNKAQTYTAEELYSIAERTGKIYSLLGFCKAIEEGVNVEGYRVVSVVVDDSDPGDYYIEFYEEGYYD